MKNQQIDTKIIQDKIKLFREIAQANDLNDFQIIKYEQWLSSTLQEVYIKGRESVIEPVDNIMDSEKAKDIGDQLEAFTGQRECKMCGFAPEHQRKYILDLLSKRGGKEEV